MDKPLGNCPYGIGSDHWPGLAKCGEEMAELQEVFCKLQGAGGSTDHWTGHLLPMMMDECADVLAAVQFFQMQNFGPREREYVESRRNWKLALFKAWQAKRPKSEWPKWEDFN